MEIIPLILETEPSWVYAIGKAYSVYIRDVCYLKQRILEVQVEVFC